MTHFFIVTNSKAVSLSLVSYFIFVRNFYNTLFKKMYVLFSGLGRAGPWETIETTLWFIGHCTQHTLVCGRLGQITLALCSF